MIVRHMTKHITYAWPAVALLLLLKFHVITSVSSTVMAISGSQADCLMSIGAGKKRCRDSCATAHAGLSSEHKICTRAVQSRPFDRAVSIAVRAAAVSEEERVASA